MKTFKGLNGTIELTDIDVQISRDNMLGTTFHSEHTIKIPYNNIRDIILVPGGLLNGYICIVEEGCAYPSNVFVAIKDENTVIFRMPKNLQASRLKQAIKSRLCGESR